MYRNHFGLSKLPFKNTPDHHFFYEQASRLDILNGLLYVIQRGDPIVKVTGEVGCGKTTLLRLLAKQLNSNFQVVYINSPNLSPKDLLFHIADELSLDCSLELPKYALIKALRQKLLQLHAEGRHVVMLVDEAQAMSKDTLEEVRLLSNIETDEDKLIQIVLFGQPELDRALEQHSLRQLRDRITYHMHVPPLTAEELKSYLNYRMRQASYKGLDFFNTAFSKRIHKLTAGLPRSINTIADQLLMAAYGYGDKTLKRRHFKNISIENIQSMHTRFWLLGGVSVSVLVLSLLALFKLDSSLAHLPSELFYSSSITENSKGVKQKGQSITDLKNDNQPEVTPSSGSIEAEDQPAINKVVEMSREVINENDVSQSEITSVSTQPPIELELIKPILSEHKKTASQLKSDEVGRYIIQLMTCSVLEFDRALQDLKYNKIPFENLSIMLDLSKDTNKFRVKFLYTHSDSYSFLIKQLSELPAGLKASRPFIAPVRHLLNDLDKTKQTLIDWDIS